MRYLTLILALLAAPAAAQDKMTLILDWFVNPDHGPIIVAEELGYFEEAGLEVEVIAPADPADPPKMVAAGRRIWASPTSRSCICRSRTACRCAASARSSPRRSTACSCWRTAREIHRRPRRDARSGSRCRASRRCCSRRSSRSTTSPSTDIELVSVNWSLSPSLMSGQVDATIGAYRNFELNQMEIEGVPGRCFYVEEEGVPAYDELIYVANPDRMDPDMIRRFLHATERATQYIVNHPQESWEIFSATSDRVAGRAQRNGLGRHLAAAGDAARRARPRALCAVRAVPARRRDDRGRDARLRPRAGSERAMTQAYGATFPRLRDAAGPVWQDYTRHAFVEGLRDGTLPRAAFLGYLVQDYIFLIHFARAWALAVTKADALDEMRACAATVDALVNQELEPARADLRRRRAERGGSVQLRGTPRQPRLYPLRARCRAFGRFPRPSGGSGALRHGLWRDRRAAGAGAGEDHPYADWIATYAGEEYQQVCRDVGTLFDGAVTRRLGDAPETTPGWERLRHRFATATRLEVGFWDMGLSFGRV